MIKRLIICSMMCTCIATTQAQLFKKIKSQIEDKAKQKVVTKTDANAIIAATLPGLTY